jgi:flagellar protein FlaG
MNIALATDPQVRGSPRPAVLAGRTGEPGKGADAPAQPAPSADRPEARGEEVEAAAEGVNAFLKSSGSHLQFAVHRETNRMMVQVIDNVTQEVVRTIPSKELLDLAAHISEMVGVLLDKKG